VWKVPINFIRVDIFIIENITIFFFLFCHLIRKVKELDLNIFGEREKSFGTEESRTEKQELFGLCIKYSWTIFFFFSYFVWIRLRSSKINKVFRVKQHCCHSSFKFLLLFFWFIN
jgi:hypothetical protein